MPEKSSETHDFTKVLTYEARRKVKVGNILVFKNEMGVRTRYKITKKKNGRVYGERAALVLSPESAIAHAGHQIDDSKDPVFCINCAKFI